jgi:hypothetical protein
MSAQRLATAILINAIMCGSIHLRHFECSYGFSECINGMWINDSDNSVHSGCVVTADVDFDGMVDIGDLLAAHD